MNTPDSYALSMAQHLWDYLVLGQDVQRADCILVFGGHDLGVARRAVELYDEHIAPLLLVSGGAANVPAGSRFNTEADAIIDVLTAAGVPRDRILAERLASNTSENFWFSAEVLRDSGHHLDRFVIVQKPYGERRTIATARRRWPTHSVRVTSEQVSFTQYSAGDIPIERILSMLAGEIFRLQRYAVSGLIQIDEPVPESLLTSAKHIQEAGYNARALDD